MPLPSQTILTIESLFVLCGCVLLWRHVISAEARKIARERRDNMPAWRISGSDFLLFLFSVIAGGVLLQGIAALLFKTSTDNMALAIVVNGSAFHGGMLSGVIFALWIIRRTKGPQPPRLDPAASRGSFFGHGFATFLIALPVLAVTGLIWQNLMNAFGVELQEQDLIGVFADTKSPVLLTLMIVLAVVVAPITEELIFRAGIFRFARTRLPRWAALLLPALLFASLHANLASFAPLTVLGIIFSLAYERTGNIAVSMVAHGLFNLNTILLVLSGVNV